jgi:hypothetical protein
MCVCEGFVMCVFVRFCNLCVCEGLVMCVFVRAL